jgi:hypothetical protein
MFGCRAASPLPMLRFEMIDRMFTWLKPAGGALTHAAMAPVVAELFLGGLHGVEFARTPLAVPPD